VASGALQVVDANTGEIRRMFVAQGWRRLGLASAVLAALEERAIHFGYSRLRLETGIRQPAAIELYEQRGYVRIDPYGPHESDPTSVALRRHSETVGTSVCSALWRVLGLRPAAWKGSPHRRCCDPPSATQ
jgi:N-acetylglutamate synthase-like GNAT family acetyltransferase